MTHEHVKESDVLCQYFVFVCVCVHPSLGLLWQCSEQRNLQSNHWEHSLWNHRNHLLQDHQNLPAGKYFFRNRHWEHFTLHNDVCSVFPLTYLDAIPSRLTLTIVLRLCVFDWFSKCVFDYSAAKTVTFTITRNALKRDTHCLFSPWLTERQTAGITTHPPPKA